MRLEGREATPPLRPRRWRLARDGGGGEVAFGVALPVRLDLIPKAQWWRATRWPRSYTYLTVTD